MILFVNEDGSFNSKVLPAIIKEQITSNYSIKEVKDKNLVRADKDTIFVLSSDYFSPKNYISKKIRITENTYSIHHFTGSWQPKWKKMLLLIWVPFTVKFPRASMFIKRIIM